MSAIRTARDIVADVADAGIALPDTGIQDLARCPEKHSEQGVQRVCREFGLELNVPQVMVPGTEIPALKLTDWVKLLLQHDLWHTTVGLRKADEQRTRRIWRRFWNIYRSYHSAHPIFQLEAEKKIDLSRCAAFIFHGDEGRSLKKKPLFVANFFSALGRGTSESVTAQKRKYIKMKINYRGPSFATRYLAGVLPKQKYGKSEENLRALLQFCADECVELTRHGVVGPRGVKHHVALLRVCGDWPFLIKAGNLRRGFNRGAKSEEATSSAGICHLCQAGQFPYPYEQLATQTPRWLGTMNQESPFSSPPELLDVPHDEARAAEFFEPDAWHAWHLGVAKSFLGSVLVLVMETFPGSSEPARYQALTDHFLAWCKVHNRRPYISKIDATTTSRTNKRTYPKGHWNKGETSTTLMRWFESWCQEFQPTAPLLAASWKAARCINRAWSALYKQDFWIPAKTAKAIGMDILEFLRLYAYLAKSAFDQDECLFSLLPKAHMIHHVGLTALVLPAQKHDLIINPLAWGCQMSEDFIGRPSRISRRVSCRQTIERTLSRYLRSVHAIWVQEGFIV